jgi:peptidoglycan/xylan/chitin deacetylase (PgdA/CDA1 family)
MLIDPVTKCLIARDDKIHARSPIMLMYHGTASGTAVPENRYSVSALRFKQQIEFLQEYKWKTICLRDLAAPAQLPQRSILITFDDGYRNNFDNAFMPLIERNMCATWFVVSGRIGQHAHWLGPKTSDTRMLEFDQLREMAASGMEIGSHTCTHPDLTVVTEDIVSYEIRRSKDELEDIFGFGITSFAYPYGRFNDHAMDAVHDAGYKHACSVRPGVVNANLEPYQLRRLTVYAEDTLSTFARKLVFASNDVNWSKMIRYTKNRIKNYFSVPGM